MAASTTLFLEPDVRAADLPESTFHWALGVVFRHEGGYANDPDDSGGPTQMGITQATWDAWRKARKQPPCHVRHCTRDDAAAIYRTGYWQPTGCATLVTYGHRFTALCHFDWAVNHGPVGARKDLQRALGVAADGIYGSKTLAAIAAADDVALCAAYLQIRARWYRRRVDEKPSQRKFLNSWLSRLRHIATMAGIPHDPLYAKTR